MQETYVQKVFAQPVAGEMKSAIQITTAGAICAVLDLLAQGRLPQQGFIRQEDIAFDDVIDYLFGVLETDGTFHPFWSRDEAGEFSLAGEHAGFERFMDFVAERRQRISVALGKEACGIDAHDEAAAAPPPPAVAPPPSSTRLRRF